VLGGGAGLGNLPVLAMKKGVFPLSKRTITMRDRPAAWMGWPAGLECRDEALRMIVVNAQEGVRDENPEWPWAS